MRKLLAANLFRLRHNTLFWISLACMSVCGLIVPAVIYSNATAYDYVYHIDDGLFACAVFIGFVMSVFCSLFLSTESSDGTIRNKMISGHTRLTIYLSNLAVSLISGFSMCAAWFISFFAIGCPLLKTFSHSSDMILFYTLGFLALAAAYAAIYTMIAMVCQKKAIVAIVCLLCAFILWFTGVYTHARLQEPEGWEAYQYVDDDGNIATYPATINPGYPSGIRREVLVFMNEFLPGGQADLLANMETDAPLRLVLYSTFIFLGTTAVGTAIFKRKDIK